MKIIEIQKNIEEFNKKNSTDLYIDPIALGSYLSKYGIKTRDINSMQLQKNMCGLVDIMFSLNKEENECGTYYLDTQVEKLSNIFTLHMQTLIENENVEEHLNKNGIIVEDGNCFQMNADGVGYMIDPRQVHAIINKLYYDKELTEYLEEKGLI